MPKLRNVEDPSIQPSESHSPACQWCGTAAPAGAATCSGCGAALSVRDDLGGLVLPGVTAVDPALQAYDAQPLRLTRPSPSQGLAGGTVAAAALGGPVGMAALGGLAAVAAVEYLGAGKPGGDRQPLEALGNPSEAARLMVERLDAERSSGGDAQGGEARGPDLGAGESAPSSPAEPRRFRHTRRCGRRVRNVTSPIRSPAIRALLIVATLVLSHQAVFLVRYGSVYGEALAHLGHGQAWSDAVAVVAIGIVALLLGAGVGAWRLAAQVRSATAAAGMAAPANRWPDAGRGVFQAWVRTSVWISIPAAIALTLQENVEHLAAGFGLPGPAILLSPEYPFALPIVVGVAAAVAAVTTLFSWRRATLAARLRSITRSFRAVRRRGAVPRNALAAALAPRPRILARRLGRRAPPTLRPA